LRLYYHDYRLKLALAAHTSLLKTR